MYKLKKFVLIHIFYVNLDLTKLASLSHCLNDPQFCYYSYLISLVGGVAWEGSAHHLIEAIIDVKIFCDLFVLNCYRVTGVGVCLLVSFSYILVQECVVVFCLCFVVVSSFVHFDKDVLVFYVFSKFCLEFVWMMVCFKFNLLYHV